MRNLVIAAHPDDEILGCGGLISKQKKNDGIDTYVLILTGGAETRYSTEMENVLKNNAIEANQIVGTKELFFEKLPNQQLDAIPLTQIVQTIEKYIADIKPDTVFTHHGGDLNKDHRMVYEATMTATRPIVGQGVKRVYAYNVPSSTEWNYIEGEKIFIPNVFIEIKEELALKIGAMQCYKSECRPYPHPRSPEAVKAHSHYWGLTVGMEYAEPFKLIRNIEGIL